MDFAKESRGQYGEMRTQVAWFAKVEFNVGDDQYIDREKEAWAMLARE